jgi:hypothetical protein
MLHREYDRRPGVRADRTPERPRRQVENLEYGAFLRRVLRAYTRRAGAGDLDALADLARLRDELDGHLADAVAVLRHEPWSYSWREIAGALGTKRHTAYERFRKAGGARRPGGQPARLR